MTMNAKELTFAKGKTRGSCVRKAAPVRRREKVQGADSRADQCRRAGDHGNWRGWPHARNHDGQLEWHAGRLRRAMEA